MDRITSFSVTSTDKEGIKALDAAKAYCKRTGTRFSYLVLWGLQLVVAELGKQGKL